MSGSLRRLTAGMAAVTSGVSAACAPNLRPVTTNPEDLLANPNSELDLRRFTKALSTSGSWTPITSLIAMHVASIWHPRQRSQR